MADQAANAGKDSATAAPRTAEASYEELREQIDILKSDLAELSAAALRAGEQTARETVARARETGRKTVDQAADQFESMLEEAEAFAQERPAIAMAIAAGLGFLLAMAMSRR